jgi:8-oxo-dGTP pyrophosphatase MutT (NUDIX family)
MSTLMFGGIATLTSGTIVYSTLCAFVALRFVAQVYETKTWHWGEENRPRTGMAATSVLVLEKGKDEPSFVLIKNQNLNRGLGLWVSPGGRWDPAMSTPTSRLLDKIAEEVNYEAQILPVGTLTPIMPPWHELENRDCKWFQPPQFVLYESLETQRSDFPHHHLDLIYLCRTDGKSAGRTPRYGQNSQVHVPVRSCASDFNAALDALARAIDEWQLRNEGKKQARRDDITHDIVWRLHLMAKALEQKATVKRKP